MPIGDIIEKREITVMMPEKKGNRGSIESKDE
jgi:hypothetical protein